jgi:hypothetical protein
MRPDPGLTAKDSGALDLCRGIDELAVKCIVYRKLCYRSRCWSWAEPFSRILFCQELDWIVREAYYLPCFYCIDHVSRVVCVGLVCIKIRGNAGER